MDYKMLKEAAANNPNEIPAPYDEIYSAAGFDGLAAILELMGGKTVYVPKLRSVLTKCIENEARKARKNKHQTMNSIARKYGYSDRQLRNLLNCNK